VSVAVGSSLAALGTDAGGSVRKPAALNGVVGLKPTRGLVSRHGVCEPTGSLDHVGTFSRTVEDAALLLSALSGPVEAGRPGVNGTRLGVCRSYCFGESLDDGVRAVVLDALDTLESEGATLVDVDIPSLPLAIPAGFTLLLADAGSGLRSYLDARAAEIHEGTRRAIELGALMPWTWVDSAQRARARLREEVRLAFRDARLDALVTPTLPRTSMPLEEMVIAVDLPRYIPLTLPWNLTGQPALTVPCGFSPEGLPVGLQVVGRPFAEAAVLRIGQGYEAVTDWSRQRPALASLLG
jgi:Asp-tRNA(Asn)/Glu-tRNA(Gln) amidotransferase A subunit family amidase